MKEIDRALEITRLFRVHKSCFDCVLLEDIDAIESALRLAAIEIRDLTAKVERVKADREWWKRQAEKSVSYTGVTSLADAITSLSKGGK